MTDRAIAGAMRVAKKNRKRNIAVGGQTSKTAKFILLKIWRYMVTQSEKFVTSSYKYKATEILVV